MHLLLPFAGAPEPAMAAAPALPRLAALLARCGPPRRDDAEPTALSPPHERAWARAHGADAPDGLVPLAAERARRDGLPVDALGPGWALMSPAHWHLGTEQVSLGDPDALGLDDAGSRALLDALAPLFDDAGWSVHWGAATRWYLHHPDLATLPTASLDRVVGRNVDPWLTADPRARPLRRRQAEAQMLLHTHPVNATREAAGALPVNSFWVSGTGALPLRDPAPALSVDDRLRAPALAGDAAAWAAAWQALDAGPVAALLARALAGDAVRLTLCGERAALQFDTRAQPWWRRGPLAPSGPPIPALLAAL